MRRLFWLAMGITIGVLVVRKLSQAAERLTPKGLAANLGSGLAELAEAVRDFSADVRDAMDDREEQLREVTGLSGNAADAGGTDSAADPATGSGERPRPT